MKKARHGVSNHPVNYQWKKGDLVVFSLPRISAMESVSLQYGMPKMIWLAYGETKLYFSLNVISLPSKPNAQNSTRTIIMIQNFLFDLNFTDKITTILIPF